MSRIRLEQRLILCRQYFGKFSLVNSLDVLRLERRTADNESIEDDTDRPGVHLETVPVRSVEQHLRSDIIRGTADRLLALTRILNKRRQSEITDLDVHVAIQKDVAQFQVPMDDLVVMHIVARADELNHEESRFRLGEASTSTKQVHERAVRTQFKRHVDVLVVFETILKVDDVGVF